MTQFSWFRLLTPAAFSALQIGALAASSTEADVRRDAAVEAVQRVMPSVVNVATEELVPVRDSVESLFREFFDPYHRRRQPNTQYSLGSGVIIDEDGFVLESFEGLDLSRPWMRLVELRRERP